MTNGKTKIALTALTVLLTVPALASCSSETQYPPLATQQPTPAPSTTEKDPEDAEQYIGTDFPARANPEFVTNIDKEALQAYPEETLKQAGVWGISFTQETAYDPTIWLNMIEKKTDDPADISGNDFLRWTEYMTTSAQDKFIKQVENRGSETKGLGNFLLLPSNNPKTEWVLPALRPWGIYNPDGTEIPSDGYTIKSVKLGPPSELDPMQKTVVLELTDYHMYDYKYNGKWTAVEVGRPWKLVLAPNEDNPDEPFKLQDWTVGEEKFRDVKPIERA